VRSHGVTSGSATARLRLRDLRFSAAASGTGMNAQITDAATAKLGESGCATLHLPLEPQLLLELPQLLHPLLLELLLQLVQPPPELDEPLSQLVQPPPPVELPDEHESQLPWWFEFEQPLSHDSELLQLGPEQSQLGDAVQFSFLFEHESPQLTDVERGGGGAVVPPSTSGGNVCDGVP
jgi:hypothetical protein